MAAQLGYMQLAQEELPPGYKRLVAEARIPPLVQCLPNGRRGTAHSRRLREHRGCNCCRAACRKCGRTRLPQYLDAWRSSYEPPVRGYRHYRQIVFRETQRSAGQNEMVLSLAVITLLLLLGLLCCVVLVVFLVRRGFTRSRFGGSDVALEFAHTRFHLIHEANVLVVPDHAGLRIVVRVPYGRGTQTHLAQVGGFNAEYAQRDRQREEGHAKRHGEPRLPDRPPNGLHCGRSPRLRALPPRRAKRRHSRLRIDVDPQALGVNARCGCQDTVDQSGWRLHLREILHPVAARLNFGKQRTTGGATPRMDLEAFEFRAGQDAVDGIHEQVFELVTRHSVSGWVWHHITCL